MPTYDFKCTACENVFEDTCSISGRDSHHPTCGCGALANYIYIPSVPLVSFLDGPSGSWPSKGNRFKQYRSQQAARAEKRQNERYTIVKNGAVPNYKGKETGTWQEAQRVAIAESGPDSASTFNSKVAEEKSKKIE